MALGFFIPPGIGPATDTTNYCEGNELGTQGDCCSPDTWDNGTYRAIKGETSIRYWNERRIRHATHELFDPPFEGAADASGLEELAYQEGAAAPLQLVERGRDAAVNFWLMLPPSHWSIKEEGVPSDCQEDGWYTVYDWHRPWTDEQIAAFERASGIELTADERAGFTSGAGTDSSRVNTWLEHAWAVVAAVPGGSNGRNVRTMPEIADLVVVVEPTTQYEQARIEPVPWLAEFIETFGTVQKKKLPAVKFKKRPDGDLVPQRGGGRRTPSRRQPPQRLFDDPSPTSDPDVKPTSRYVVAAPITFAGGALAALAAWWGRRRG